MPRSMARTRRRGAPPRTISRPALLVDGSDGEFRGLIHDLIAYGHRLDACRDAFAAIVGISGVQYEILMLVSRADGLSIRQVAERLHRSGAFITISPKKLAVADLKGFLERYRKVHVPAVTSWPGLRRMVIHTPVDWKDPFPVNRGRAVLMAQLEFDSEEAMNRAFASPERAAAREDFKRFMTYEGTVTHQAMATEEVWRRGK